MFNICDSKLNGEYLFYKTIEPNIDVIFDVGCRKDSEFTDFHGEVHYFDPVKEFIENLSMQPNQNRVAVFNSFGLSDVNDTLYYYPKYQSFYDRVASCQISDEENKILFEVRKAADYIREKNVPKIDFLKIDTEGYELKVLRGLEDDLHNVRFLQFEYGGTAHDSHVGLADMVDYLKEYSFERFSYLTNDGPVPILDFSDHYQYCNIVCFQKDADTLPSVE
jgi:FkbM family methyltransferase